MLVSILVYGFRGLVLSGGSDFLDPCFCVLRGAIGTGAGAKMVCFDLSSALLCLPGFYLSIFVFCLRPFCLRSSYSRSSSSSSILIFGLESSIFFLRPSYSRSRSSIFDLLIFDLLPTRKDRNHLRHMGRQLDR